MADNISPSSNSYNTDPSGVTQTDGYNPNGLSSPNAPAPDSPSSARLFGSGLVTGATNALASAAGKVFNFNFLGTNGTALPMDSDWRVRISMQNTLASIFYNNPNNLIMYPLSQTKGLVFPYTPSVTVAHSARYGTSPLTHSNYASYFYEGSEVGSIRIQADFTVQNVDEGQYLMAAIQFMRSTTKMFYGNSDLAGTPPPMVFLNGYGPAYLPNVPCVVQSFEHTMPADVDYVDIPVATVLNSSAGSQINQNSSGVLTRLPTNSTMSIVLQPVYSRTNIYDNFTLETYAAGLLMQGSGNALGGFV
jgi:hypothetical protein